MKRWTDILILISINLPILVKHSASANAEREANLSGIVPQLFTQKIKKAVRQNASNYDVEMLLYKASIEDNRRNAEAIEDGSRKAMWSREQTQTKSENKAELQKTTFSMIASEGEERRDGVRTKREEGPWPFALDADDYAQMRQMLPDMLSSAVNASDELEAWVISFGQPKANGEMAGDAEKAGQLVARWLKAIGQEWDTLGEMQRAPLRYPAYKKYLENYKYLRPGVAFSFKVTPNPLASFAQQHYEQGLKKQLLVDEYLEGFKSTATPTITMTAEPTDETETTKSAETELAGG